MRSQALIAITAITALASLASASLARGAISDDEELFRIGGAGSAAGQFSAPRDVASDPTTGHIYVADSNNHRVSEFTPWGEFVKAFGWDVAPGPVNEQQEVRVGASGGQFKLSLGAEASADLPFDASASEVEAALKGLAAIGSEGVSVKSVPGTADGKTPYVHVVTFKGPLAATDVAQLMTTNGSASLSGTAEVRTRADGHGPTGELESCTAESGCKAGLGGSAAGQFDPVWVGGVAVDAAGDVYVRDVTNRRVQKFDPAGRFVLMFGGKVNKTTSADICTEASGDECGAGVIGAGPGEFGAGVASGIALSSSGALFVGDVERIQRFNPAGEWQASVACPGKTIYFLAIAPGSGDFYAAVGSSGPEQDIRKLDGTTCAETGQLKGTGAGQGAVATDAAGNVFIKDGSEVLQFGPSGSPLSPPGCCKGEVGISGLATNAIGDLYVASFNTPTGVNIVRAFGPAPVSFEGPPPVAPEVTAQFASTVGRDSATVAADINPNFFTDTTYFVQYGTGKCSEGGCDKEAPVPPSPLTKKAVKAPVRSAGVSLAGLLPGTTYHYRFVAQSSGGGPVFGEEAALTTFPAAASMRPCANDIFRFGSAALLPNCRAYEMVSPVDKNNGDIKTLLDFSGLTTNLSQSATDGNRFTYSSQRGFADPKAATYTNQYLANRNPQSGWSSEALEPAQTSHFSSNSFENHYKAFSADLCQSWLMVAAEPVLVAETTPEGYRELYRRPGGNGCGTPSFEALVRTEPTTPPGPFFPLLQGVTADGIAAVFAVQDKLTPEAGSGVWQVYHSSAGGLRPVCVLPSGLASGSNCSAGTGEMAGGIPGITYMERMASLTNAFSKDGAKAYWTDSAGAEAGPGKIYLRLNPGKEQSASGCEAGKACTVAVSGTASQQNARFLRASADGTKALFEITAGGLAGNLYKFEFDAEGSSSTLIAGKSLGVAGASDDLSRVYFVSENVLAGTTGASAGEPNLYLDEDGAKTFVARLGSGDVGLGIAVSNTTPWPIYHAARSTPDGRVLAFISSEPLTGYDNTDLASGKADAEVYVYEAGAAEPVCVSCNPSGARPAGRSVEIGRARALPTAAWLPFPENSLYSPRVISGDGRRLFFNSFDALLPRDSNGKADVYQWESASGQAACDERGAELYVPDSGGCLSLISTGQSPQDSELLDISANGNDAFFTTNASLLPRDPGLVDVYDARAGGGIAEPPAPPPVCQGETCQPVIPAPAQQTPSSSSYVGPEDQKPAKAKKKKAKQKKKKKKAKHKSAKKKQHKKKGKASRGRGGKR